MAFAFFIFLNALLLIRPEELNPAWEGLRLYLITIVLCIMTALPGILVQLSLESLRERPITVCAFGMLLALSLADLARGQFDFLEDAFPEFVKVLLYFLLFMVLVNSWQRMRAFMGWVVGFVIVLSIFGLLQFHDFIDIEAIRPVEHREYDPNTGEIVTTYRLCSSGIYSDPNDLCLILVTGSLCCLCRSAFARTSMMRVLWLCPIGLFIYAMMLTQSRGGLLGLLAAVLALLYARYGWKRSLPLAALMLPVMLALFAGRQANLSTTEDTAQERLKLWAEGIALMYNYPVFGIGVGEFAKDLGLVAHNSFVQAYVETGLFGGTLFLGAFYLAVAGPWRTHRELGREDRSDDLTRMYPFVFAMVVGYAAGAYSVSRNFVIPTYMILGLAGSFVAIAYNKTPEWFCVTQRLAKRLVVVGILGFVFLKVFTQTMVQYN